MSWELNKELTFILSTGRTGTMFFQDYINSTCQGFKCLHEPKPSRRFIFLSNLFQAGKISPKRFTDIYFRSRKNLFHSLKENKYIESSNFMSGGVFALNQYIDDIKIIHLVRHPQSYVKSHFDYGYWKGYKQFVRRVIPYSVENLPLTFKEKQNPMLVLFSRWKVINNMLGKYKKTNNYLLVRFEDIFKSDEEKASKKLNEIRSFIGCKSLSLNETQKWVNTPKNVSRKKKHNNVLVEENLWYLKENLQGEMLKFGYQINEF